MPDATRDEVVSRLTSTASVISALVRRTVREEEDAALTPAQYRALSLLAEHEGASLTDLAEGYGTSAPATSSLVDGLVKRGLVTRDQDPQDRRRVVLRLTPEGRTVLRSTRAAVRTVLRRIVDALEPHELATVDEAMGLLRAALERSSPREAAA